MLAKYLEIKKGVTTLRLMSEKKSEALQHTTAKLHPEIFREIDKKVKKKEFTSFNSALNQLLFKALNIKS